ncbi:hypothetical protein HZA85_04210 [Candidatus Uhrbacteria bacterium]|nr:hypothetical protein [Candidatus Uhrbacteria bacterium]
MPSRAWFNVASLIVLISLCIGYVVQVNRTVSQGYQMRELETRINDLTITNQKMEVATQQAQSLDNIARATKMIGLVKAERPVYVQAGAPSYAMAK